MTPAAPAFERSGVYGGPPDVSPARAWAKAAGAAWMTVDLASARDKQSLLATLARACGFPSGFGANWDALADSLQDFSWLNAAGYVLLVRQAQGARHALGDDWHTLIEILRQSAMYWRQRRRAFVVLVEGDDELPPW